MAGPMRRMMEYLSFAEPQDEVYEDEYTETYEDESPAPEKREDERRPFGSSRVDSSESHTRDRLTDSSDRTERLERVVDEHRAEVTPINAHRGHELRRIVTVHPSTYNEARSIGEAFRDGTPVIMNLTTMNEADAKRMVDFAAGLVFGLHGAIERVTNRVFLLSPATVEIDSDSEESEGGPGRFFNQS